MSDETNGARQGALLSVRDLRIEYATSEGSTPLVSEATLAVAPGEIVCLVGESGSGKTLTARAVMGLLRANPRIAVRGDITFDGRDLLGASDRALRGLRGRDISMIFQDPVAALDPVMTIGAQIAEAVRARSLPRRDVPKRVLELIDSVGISDPGQRAKQYPSEISGGMCQRVGIAIALASDPKLLIADEPTTALDVTIQAQVLDLLRTLRDERAMSILLITHDMGVAAQIADRVLVMYAGAVVEHAPTRPFFARPGHPYSTGLVRAVPRVRDEREERLATIAGAVPEARDRPSGCPFHPRCPLAQARCREERPALAEVGASGHLVACHRAAEVLSGAAVAWRAAGRETHLAVGV